jgi:hypothetical protein
MSCDGSEGVCSIKKYGFFLFFIDFRTESGCADFTLDDIYVCFGLWLFLFW